MEVIVPDVKQEYTPDNIPNSERETQRLSSVSPNPQANSQQQQQYSGGGASRNNSGGATSGKSNTVLNHHLTSGGGILTSSASSSSSTVIQSPSVIQSASGQLQLSKGNVILVSSPSKHPGNSSVIQTAGGGLQSVQIIDSHHSDESLSNDAIEHHQIPSSGRSGDRKRREILTRRPSYRKILSDLGGGDKGDLSTSESSQDAAEGQGNNRIVIGEYPQSMVKVINANTLGLSGATSADSVGGTALQTITMTNAGTAGGTIVQYAQSQDGQQFFVPVGAELQAYTIRPVSSASSSPSVILGGGGGGGGGGHHVPEEATRKREIRLLKNREAARECRRKKKEYIKCLENRVAVLENQNKALIDELKSLKELYCQQKTE